MAVSIYSVGVSIYSVGNLEGLSLIFSRGQYIFSRESQGAVIYIQ